MLLVECDCRYQTFIDRSSAQEPKTSEGHEHSFTMFINKSVMHGQQNIKRLTRTVNEAANSCYN